MNSESGKDRLTPFPDSGCFSHDTDQVYYRDHLIDLADIHTFTVFPADYDHYQYLTPLAADKDAFYADCERLTFKDACKTQILAPFNSGDCLYLFAHENSLFRINKNNNCIEQVYTDTAIEDIEVIQTESSYIAPHYFRTGKGVFFYDISDNTLITLPEADPGTFEGYAASYSFDIYWGKDSRNIYCFCSLVKDADHETFEYLGWVYAKDRNHVYSLENRTWKIIPEADPLTFTPVKGDGIDASDINHSYNSGRIAD